MRSLAWIEGITSSKNILCDIANIWTSCNRDAGVPIPEKNWKLVFPILAEGIVIDSPEARAAILLSNRIVLKTTTSPVIVDSTLDPFHTDPDLTKSQTTMYVEFKKPDFLVNPETGSNEIVVNPITGETDIIPNRHYVNVRIFDKWNPDENVENIEYQPTVKTKELMITNDQYLVYAIQYPVDDTPAPVIFDSAIGETPVNPDDYELDEETGSKFTFAVPRYQEVTDGRLEYMFGNNYRVYCIPEKRTNDGTIVTVTNVKVNGELMDPALAYDVDLAAQTVTFKTPAKIINTIANEDAINISENLAGLLKNTKFQLLHDDLTDDTVTINITIIGSTQPVPTSIIDRTQGIITFEDGLGNDAVVKVSYKYFKSINFEQLKPIVTAEYRWIGKLRCTYTTNGEPKPISVGIEKGGHISEWSKFSWYTDFKEQLRDVYDTDAGTSNINEGIVFMPVITPGLYEDVPVLYWMSVCNDFVSIVLQGDPSVNYDNYLISFGYFGAIDSFTRDVSGVQKPYLNDVVGNFALTVGSSTVPCFTFPEVSKPLQFNPEILEMTSLSESFTSSNFSLTEDGTPVAYSRTDATTNANYKLSQIGLRIVAGNNEMYSAPSPYAQSDIFLRRSLGILPYPDPTNITLKIKIPSNATYVKVYRYSGSLATTDPRLALVERTTGESCPNAGPYDKSYFMTSVDVTGLTPVVGESDTYLLELTDVKAALSLTAPVAQITNGRTDSGTQKPVIRDEILYNGQVYGSGAIMEINFPQNWGPMTATGVNDICMLKTRSGTYFQKHNTSFITPDELMQKEAFNPSRWTGHFHLSPCYLVHGYDGYRGWLKGTVVVDNSSIIHQDELVVNKGKVNEEIYKYFRVTAPFSFLTNSPNNRYGIAIKKDKEQYGVKE